MTVCYNVTMAVSLGIGYLMTSQGPMPLVTFLEKLVFLLILNVFIQWRTVR